MHLTLFRNLFLGKNPFNYFPRPFTQFHYQKLRHQQFRFSTSAMSSSNATQKYKLIYFVPTAALDDTKAAIFAAGAGRYPGPGNYTECAWVTSGTGQFRPGDAANPHIGKVGQLEFVPEQRVETIIIGDEVARKVVQALKDAHPYQEPAYDVIKVEDF
ncbi:hypothetical protein TWF730_004799 [Orbilia blumenaviensis]|uniref:ATP phosphoribosyltransferase n=1 Tax=Orbilia blumenaviensis TaxID=1796055 RepID=A0AAV9TXA7_9PEZI